MAKLTLGRKLNHHRKVRTVELGIFEYTLIAALRLSKRPLRLGEIIHKLVELGWNEITALASAKDGLKALVEAGLVQATNDGGEQTTLYAISGHLHVTLAGPHLQKRGEP